MPITSKWLRSNVAMHVIKRNTQIFRRVDTVQVNGGHFVNASGSVYYKAHPKPLDILYHHSAPGALLDSSERFDPPKCDQDTRVAILQTIMDWIICGDNSSSILWLHGPAGSGKSALGQSIAERCNEQELLAAAFFFSRNTSTSDRSDGKLLISTLVHQLTSTFPKTRRYVQKYIQKDESIFDRNIDAQAKNLLILPVKKLRGSVMYFLQRLFFHSKQPRLIVVDGLDECNDPNIQIEILQALARSSRELGLPFRILIASRPESHICRAFDYDPSLSAAHVTRIDLVDSMDSEKDIRTYLGSEFKKIVGTHRLREHIPASWPEEAAIETLVDRASGQFIYASTIMKYIQSPKHRPTNRLQVILGLFATPVNETPYASLDALYTHIFFSVDSLPRVMQIFSTLVITRTPNDGLGVFNTPEMLDKLLFFQPGDTELILSDLLSIIRLDNHQSPVRLHHASLGDFLLDPSRSGSLFVDLGKAHEHLAIGYMTLLQDVAVSSQTSPHADHKQQFDLYLTPFLRNCDKATFSDNFMESLERLDFVAIFRHFTGRFPSNTPEFITRGFKYADAEAMESFWRIRSAWKSRGMEQLLRPFTRKEIGSDVYERILNSYMQTLYSNYCPLDNAIKEALDSLLSQPRFRDYIFQICDHADYTKCQRCQQISPLASALSYRLIYAIMLHQPTIHLGGLYKDEGRQFGVLCAQRAYVCLIFLYGIINAIVTANSSVGAIKIAGQQKINNRREKIKAQSQLKSCADFYFGASLDCAVILLSYSDYSRNLVDLVSKTELLSGLGQDYTLRRFDIQFKLLQSEIAAYLRRIEHNE